MKKYLEYRDDKSAKFWEITVTGNSHTVRYGKIGSGGQSKSKEFPSAKEAGKDAEGLILSKVKKGYREANQDDSSAKDVDITEWWEGLDSTWQELLKGAAKIKAGVGEKELRKIKRLEELEIFAKYTISDLQPLSFLENLEELSIYSQKNIRKLAPLQKLKNLRNLEIYNSSVSDLSSISDLTGLQNLSLSRTKVKDLSPLSNLKQLHSLCIDNTNVSDLSPLKDLENLEKIEFRETSVVSIRPILSLSGLKTIICWDTKISFREYLHSFDEGTFSEIRIRCDYLKSGLFLKEIQRPEFSLEEHKESVGLAASFAITNESSKESVSLLAHCLKNLPGSIPENRIAEIKNKFQQDKGKGYLAKIDKELDALLSGYSPVKGSGAPVGLSREVWDEISLADDQSRAVAKYIKTIFPDSEEKVIQLLMKQFDSAGLTEDGFLYLNFRLVEYDHIITFTFFPPVERILPFVSLQALYNIHGEIQGECLGGGLLCCPARTMVSDWFEEGDDFLIGMDDLDDFYPLVFDVGQNAMVAHPGKKNKGGEPALFFLDHEEGEPFALSNAEQLSARQIFLMLIVQYLGAKTYFEEVSF